MPPKKKSTNDTDVPSKAGASVLSQTRDILGKVLKEDDPTISVDPGQLRQSRAHIPTGSIVLDYLIGGAPNRFGVAPCPGWPRGAISNIYGPESSGKTTVALTAAAGVTKRGGTVVFIDWEHALDLTYASSLGVPVDDPDRFLLVAPNTLEAGLKVLYVAARKGVDLIILDSVGAGSPEDLVKKSVAEQGELGRLGMVAAKWSSFLPQLAAIVSKSGTHVMGISQLRDNVGNTMGHGEKSTQQGGRAWKFFSAVRMRFQRIGGEKGSVYDAILHKTTEQYVCSEIKAKVDKSKVSQSQQHEHTFWITFGEGVDDLRSIIDVCTAHGVIKKGGTWLTWERGNGEVIKSQGLKSFRADVLNATGAIEELAVAAKRKIAEALANGQVVVDPDEADEVANNLSALLGEAEDVGGEVAAMMSVDPETLPDDE